MCDEVACLCMRVGRCQINGRGQHLNVFTMWHRVMPTAKREPAAKVRCPMESKERRNVPAAHIELSAPCSSSLCRIRYASREARKSGIVRSGGHTKPRPSKCLHCPGQGHIEGQQLNAGSGGIEVEMPITTAIAPVWQADGCKSNSCTDAAKCTSFGGS